MQIPDQPLRVQSLAEWRLWLQANHAVQKDVWLVILKNRVTAPGIFYEEAVEEALCFGWIDGVMKGAAGDFYYLRFSPRKRGSLWSVSNQERVERLIAQGRMTDAGMAKVTEAKESGEWEAAIRREDTSNLPEDLRRALENNAATQANFDRLSPSHKKQYLYWIASAKTEQTRQNRIRDLVEMATRNAWFGER